MFAAPLLTAYSKDVVFGGSFFLWLGKELRLVRDLFSAASGFSPQHNLGRVFASFDDYLVVSHHFF